MLVICFRILANTMEENIALPNAFITCGNLDENILRQYMSETVPENTDITADKIEELLLIAADADTKDVYFEALDPYKYWPIKESEKHASLRAKFRE